MDDPLEELKEAARRENEQLRKRRRLLADLNRAFESAFGRRHIPGGHALYMTPGRFELRDRR